VLSAGLLLHCSSRAHPPLLYDAPVDGGGDPTGPDAGLALGDAGLTPALCGSEQIPAISDPPNLYFIIDRSQSMTEKPAGSPYTKYENARIAISVMLRAVGHRLRYGAAVFPSLADRDGCTPGQPLVPTSAGDPPSYAAKGENGPVLTGMLTTIGNAPPAGGATPTAASLRELLPTVVGLTGRKTYVVLMTDGAPNCNAALRCSVDDCIPNIEGDSFSGTACDRTFNCCDPKVGGACIDRQDSIAAVQEYEAAGIDTYVVGMPGSEAYASLLNQLAIAGNTARPGSTQYYAVSDTNALSDALRGIGAQVAISCDLPLAQAPTNPELVNVYFDNQLVPQNTKNGWHYAADAAIQFQGDACNELGSGDVLNVQVLSGCPTVVR